MRRREYLATVGMVALAGCDTPGSDAESTGPEMKSGGFTSGGGR